MLLQTITRYRVYMEYSSQNLLLRFERQNHSLVEAVRLVSSRISGRALLVGGFVRDLLLDLSPTDADLEVYGVEADTLKKILTELFPRRVNLVGRSFGVFKIALGDGFELDVALPRRESKTGTGHKDFRVEGDPNLSFEEAARRRDFTVNTILLDPITGELIDPWHGLNDLEKNILRMVDQDHFGEDPLRVYRAVQFAARFELTLESNTFVMLRTMVERGELEHLPKERVTEEWRKLLLKAKKPSIGLTLLRELGIISRDYPELQSLFDVPQDPEWHPEGDVWIHTCMAVDKAAQIIRRDTFTQVEKLQIVVGALCHDLGKASTTVMAPKNGVMRLRSLGHEDAGVEPAQAWTKRLCLGSEVNYAAIIGAKEHLKPGILARAADKDGWSEEQYVNAVRKLLKRIYPLSWKVLVAISEADHRGRTLPDSEDQIYPDGARMTKMIKKHHLDQTPTKTLVNGQDLLEMGILPGPEIGGLIRMAEEERDQGTIKTREEALEYLKPFLTK